MGRMVVTHERAHSVFFKRQSGKSQGYGFVDYFDYESAKLALDTLNGRKIMDNVSFSLGAGVNRIFTGWYS